MIDELKEFVKNNAILLFNTSSDNSLEAVFDEKGFFFHPSTLPIYNKIKSLPHIYVAFTNGGYIYIGLSNQHGGRWKRQHAYHLGTLAHHLLGTIRYDDQNHLHWIDAWMDIASLKTNNKLNTIALKETVYISFIPFELYSGFDNFHERGGLPTKGIERLINKEVESALIKSYSLDGYKLLNVQKTIRVNQKVTKSGMNRRPPSSTPFIDIDTDNLGMYKAVNQNCVEFNVLATESVHTQIRLIPLPIKATYNISVFDSSNKGIVIYSGMTSTPYQYFGRVGKGGVTRWRIIQSEMLARGIKQITVSVC